MISYDKRILHGERECVCRSGKQIRVAWYYIGYGKHLEVFSILRISLLRQNLMTMIILDGIIFMKLVIALGVVESCNW